MTTTRRICAALALSAVLASSAGCVVAALAVGAAATYGVVKYTDNEAYQDFSADFDDTWSATLSALRENGYPVGDARPGPDGRIEIADAKVTIQRLTQDATRVYVRVGTFSTDEHKRRAAQILERIENRLD